MKVQKRTLIYWLLAVFVLGGSMRAAEIGLNYEAGEGPGAGKKVVLVSGDEEYRSEEVLTQLARILSERHGFDCRVLFAVDPETGIVNPQVRDNIPGLEALDEADLMVIFTRWRDLPAEQYEPLVRYLESGKPVVGLRTATHAIAPAGAAHEKLRAWQRARKKDAEKAGPDAGITEAEWGPYGYLGDGYNGPEERWAGGFGKFVLGETWVAHHGHHKHESTLGLIAPGAEGHPVVRGIEDGDIWGPSDVYTVSLPLPGDSEPLVLGQVLARKGEFNEDDVNFGMRSDDGPPVAEKNDPMMPVAWTKTYEAVAGKKGRVFTTTMGASADFVSEGLRRLVVNGIYWAAGLEDEIPEGGTDAEIVGEFEPTAFGFHPPEYWIERNVKPEYFK